MKNKRIYCSIILTAVLVAAIGLGVYGHSVVSAKNKVKIPIILYHHIDEVGSGDATIRKDVFLSHLDALAAAGYETLSFDDAIAYVEDGKDLPEKSVIITFDDGYLSTYDIAFPALQERGMKGTVFVIGHAVGKDLYKDTGKAMIPHFSYEQAREMADSGYMDVESHTYDMHQYAPLEPDGGRKGVLPKDGESKEAYRESLKQDLEQSLNGIRQGIGRESHILAYPQGLHTEDSEAVCRELGIRITLTTKMEHAVLKRNDPESLYLLGRYSIDDCTAEELLAMIQ